MARRSKWAHTARYVGIAWSGLPNHSGRKHEVLSPGSPLNVIAILKNINVAQGQGGFRAVRSGLAP